MTRFDLDMDGVMEPYEHGRWIRYEDAQRTWVGLTEEEVSEVAAQGHQRWLEFYYAIEAKLKERNT